MMASIFPIGSDCIIILAQQLIMINKIAQMCYGMGRVPLQINTASIFPIGSHCITVLRYYFAQQLLMINNIGQMYRMGSAQLQINDRKRISTWFCCN